MLVYRRNKPHKAFASQKNHLIGVPAVFATFSGDLHERSCSQDFWLTNSSSTKQLHYRFVFWSLSLHKSSIQDPTISSRTACLKIEFIEHRIFLEDFIPKEGTCYNTGILIYSYIKPPTHPPNVHPPTQPFDPDVHLSTHWVFPTSWWFTKDIFCQAKVCYCIAQAQDGGTAVGTRWPRITRVQTHNLRGFEGIWYFLLRILKNVK